ncbi:MAG: protein kinase [Bacteroidales bacterium]|nr:protein kinase [Bacteroidales bacterium]
MMPPSKFQQGNPPKSKRQPDRTDVRISFDKLSVYNLRELTAQIDQIENYSLDLDRRVSLKYKTQEAILDQIFLGQGGNGFVLKYLDTGNEENIVAIKFLTNEENYKTELANNIIVRDAFKAAERETHIISFYEYGEIPIKLFGKDFKLYYIVMEYVDVDLERMICEKATIDSELKQQYFSQIFKRLIEDLNTLHCYGHIHRDLKPSNILIKGEYPILADFGLVAQEDSSEKKKGPKYWPTPEFVEPCEDRDQKLDKNTDLFQLGCIFYWMVTKKYPIGFFNFTAELTQSKIGAELTELLTNMLAYEKSSRRVTAF